MLRLIRVKVGDKLVITTNRMPYLGEYGEELTVVKILDASENLVLVNDKGCGYRSWVVPHTHWCKRARTTQQGGS